MYMMYIIKSMAKKSKFDVIIQARMGSTRLPGKVLKNYKSKNLLNVLVNRLNKSQNIQKIIICTTKLKQDERIVRFCKKNNINFFRGENQDVLSRYYFAAKKFQSKIIIRITSDCPFIDFRILDKMIKKFKNNNIDYYANSYPLPTKFPDGMDIEIFKFSTLKKTFKNAKLPSEREHVTPFMFNSKIFKCRKLDLYKNFSKYRFCVDFKEDFLLFKKIIDHYKNNVYNLSMYELIKFVQRNKKYIQYQKKIKRNSGWNKSLKADEKYKKK